MRKILLLCLAVFSGQVFSAWADDDLDPSVRFHTWGVEGDLAWRPVVLVPGTQTTFWSGAEVLYKSWSYFRFSDTGEYTPTSTGSDASVKELNGAWFLGLSQGLLGQQNPQGPGNQPWENPDLIEAWGYYRGEVLHTLSSGSNLGDSSLPDKNGYVQTAFLTGVDFNMVTKADEHNLKSGLLLEGAFQTLPPGFQSVSVDDNRLTGIATVFLPVFDLDPVRRLNTLSLLGGVNIAWDHLWGTHIPAEELQLIGGRSLNGVVGFVEGIGGQVRGVEPGRFDGLDKVVTNVDLRLNLPAFDIPDFARNLSPIPIHGSVIPGVLFFYDYGAYNNLPGILPGNVTTAGVGLYLQVANLGSAAVYACDWLNGGSLYQSQPLDLAFSLGMQF